MRIDFTYKALRRIAHLDIHNVGGGRIADRLLQTYGAGSKPFFGDDKIVFTCESWLLFPAVKQMLSPQSNLFAFISDYELMDSGYYDDFFSWAWRLYDTKEQDIDKLPQNTSLRKKYIDYVKSGKKSGWGYGAFVYSDANAEV